MKRNYRQISKGFTLIELLVVIAIIGALASISMIALYKVSMNGKDKVSKTLVKALASELEDVKADDVTLPDGDGSHTSTMALYTLLSGDTNGNGKIDGGEIIEAAYMPDLLPPLDESGNIDFSSAECRVKNIELQDGVWRAKQEQGTTLTAPYAICDAFGQPLRYRQSSGSGRKNNLDGGFDIWSAGQDGITGTDPSVTPTKANGMLDDNGNW